MGSGECRHPCGALVLYIIFPGYDALAAFGKEVQGALVLSHCPGSNWGFAGVGFDYSAFYPSVLASCCLFDILFPLSVSLANSAESDSSYACRSRQSLGCSVDRFPPSVLRLWFSALAFLLRLLSLAG